MAKIASDLDKPDGLCVLTEESWLERVGEKPGLDPARRRPEDLRAARRRSGSRRSPSSPSADAGAGSSRPSAQRTAPGCAAAANGVGDQPADDRARAQVREPRDDVRRRRQPTAASCAGRSTGSRDSVCSSLESHGTPGRTVTMKIRLAPLPHLHALADARRGDQRRRTSSRAVAGSCSRPSSATRPVRLLGVGSRRARRQRTSEAPGREPAGTLIARRLVAWRTWWPRSAPMPTKPSLFLVAVGQVVLAVARVGAAVDDRHGDVLLPW